MDDDDLFSTFMSQYAENPYEQDLGTPLDAMDNETAKFYRQQALAQSGESPLAGMGPGAGAFDLTKINTTGLDKFGSFLKNMGGKALDFAQTPKGLMALLAAFAALKDRMPATGGGTTMGMMAPRQYARSVDPKGIVRYAAEGGLMHAYANGGAVRPFPMQDGGFVMTGDAVKGAGGIDNLQRVLPEARPITGPGTATSDSIPATIRGRNGITPAKVSNGEAYVPPGYDTKGLYALMRELERNA